MNVEYSNITSLINSLSLRYARWQNVTLFSRSKHFMGDSTQKDRQRIKLKNS